MRCLATSSVHIGILTQTCFSSIVFNHESNTILLLVVHGTVKNSSVPLFVNENSLSKITIFSVLWIWFSAYQLKRGITVHHSFINFNITKLVILTVSKFLLKTLVHCNNLMFLQLSSDRDFHNSLLAVYLGH